MSATERSQARRAFSLLFDYIRRDRSLLVKALILLVLATAADVAGPLLAKVYIDDYLMPGNLQWQPVGLLLGGYLLVQILAAWLRFHQTMKFTDMALVAVQDIRERAFRRALRLPLGWFDHAITGQVVSRITNDTESIKDLYVQFLSVVLTNTVLLMGILIAMAVLDTFLMLIALLMIPAVVGLIWLYQRASGAAVSRQRQLRSEINGLVSESISGMGVIQASGQQDRFINRFETLNQPYYQSRLRTIRISAALLRPAIDLMSVLVLVAVIWGFGLQPAEQTLEIGVLYAFINLLGRFTEPLAEITQRFNLYQQAMIAGRRVQELLDEPEDNALSQPGTGSVSKGHIQVQKLSFGYQPKKPVLRGISFDLPPGQFLGIAGPTGSGKSTLLSLLLRYYAPDNGTIRIDDQPLQSLSNAALRDGIGLIPQEPFIVAGSIRDNIDMGRGLGDVAIEQAAAQAHLLPMIQQLPQGMYTLLGERGTRLSTGQRQQLVIARALAGSPRVLLLDEATASVDSETEQVVQRALHELHGKVSLIVIAHRLSTIREADNILLLVNGEIVESGSHRALMKTKQGRYARLYRLQQQATRVQDAEQYSTETLKHKTVDQRE
jgi:ATP-binding cassette subfamily B protein/ATP-binding cassette subfamily C protein/ATP-binding cassette subfamily B multidrug efflux pump